MFYKGFVKAQEHALFSLGYSRQSSLARLALFEKFEGYLIKYRSKLSKIDGLAARLSRIKARQAAEEKEASGCGALQQ